MKANLGSGYTGLKGKSFQAQKVSGKTYYRVMIVKQMEDRQYLRLHVFQ